MIETVLAAIDRHRQESLAGLKEFLRIPSVSTKPEHRPDMRHCADWLASQLGAAGAAATVHPTAGHPIILAQTPRKADRPTVLLYGHYDVQPPEPLELWKTPPFDPTVRENDAGMQAIYARGAADDKGQVWCHVEALRAWKVAGELPINLTVLIEGEEEIGSDNLAAFMSSHRDALKADVALISDTNQFSRGVPAITYGLRGLCYLEVFVTGPNHDLHSGLYGGAVPNPANVLCAMLGDLHDAQGRVTIPGFYDDVTPLTDTERNAWTALGFDESRFAASVGIPRGVGEAGYSSLERKWARPTCDINGLTSGYQGHGAKTIIPSTASAKVSMRLVPHMDPRKIADALEQTLTQRCPPECKIRFERHGLAGATLVPLRSRAVELAADAIEVGFGHPATFMREGGSIPVVGLIKTQLGIDTLLVGFGLDDDRIHSPNEKFDLDAFHSGTRTAAALYDRLGQLR